MNITLEMITTRFFELQPKAFTSYDFTLENIHGVKLLPSDTSEIPKDFIYVTDKSKNLSLYLSDDNVCIFNIPKSVLPLADAFNSLLKSYGEFIEWDRQLDIALFSEASFQEILDISDRFFKCPILIYDPALKLLAYTRPDENKDDKLFQSVISNGFMSHEAMEHFINAKIPASSSTSDLSKELLNTMHIHDDIVRSININNQLVIYCILVQTNEYPKSYLQSLYDILYKTLENLMQKKMSNFVRNRSVTDYFLMDLLDNPDTLPSQIKERNFHNDLDYEGNYILINIFSNHIKYVSADYYVQNLRNIMINCRIFFYKSSIVILYIMPPFPYAGQKNYLLKTLKPLSKQFSDSDMRIFISRAFSDLSYFSNCYLQTEKLSECFSEGGIYFYDDHSTDCLIHCLGQEHRTFNLCHPVILELLNQDTKKSLQLLKMLELYLNFDRNVTQTASILNMHRNNVIYHISQFEERYALDLSDSSTRLSLLLSFRVLKDL